MELAVQAVSLDGELSVSGNEILQGQGLDALIQLFKGPGREAAQQNHDAFAHTKLQIGSGHGVEAAGKKRPAVFHPDVVQLHTPELVADQTLQSEQTGNGKSKFVIHGVSVSKNSISSYSRVIIFDLYGNSNRKSEVLHEQGDAF